MPLSFFVSLSLTPILFLCILSLPSRRTVPQALPCATPLRPVATRQSATCASLLCPVATGLSLFYLPAPILNCRFAKSIAQVGSTLCESSERLNMLKSEFVAASDENSELKRKVRELTEKFRLAEQRKDQAEKQVLVLSDQKKATVKGLRTNPSVVPDESVNPRLAKVLKKVAVNKEIIVALANSNVNEMLELGYSVLLSDVDIVYLQNPI
ncbi:hypothetical protein ACLB2K_041089 [Fragaria x ananassa]